MSFKRLTFNLKLGGPLLKAEKFNVNDTARWSLNPKVRKSVSWQKGNRL